MKRRKEQIILCLQKMINQVMREHPDFQAIKKVEDRVARHNSPQLFSNKYYQHRLGLQELGIKQIIKTINIVENGLKAPTLEEDEIRRLYLPSHRLFHTKLLELSNAALFKILFSALLGFVGLNVFVCLANSSFDASETRKTFQYTAAALLVPYLLNQHVFDIIQDERKNYIRHFFGVDFGQVKNLCAEYQELQNAKLAALTSNSAHVYLGQKN